MPFFRPLATALRGLTTGTTVVRINAGGPSLTDSAGRKWVADTSFIGGKVAKTPRPIVRTLDQALYGTERFAMTGYTVSVPGAGTYLLRLHLVEFYFTASGARVMSVTAESQSVLDHFDIWAATREARPIIIETPVNVPGTLLRLHFSATADAPKVAGIEVVRLTTVTPPPDPEPVPIPTPLPTTYGSYRVGGY